MKPACFKALTLRSFRASTATAVRRPPIRGCISALPPECVDLVLCCLHWSEVAAALRAGRLFREALESPRCSFWRHAPFEVTLLQKHRWALGALACARLRRLELWEYRNRSFDPNCIPEECRFDAYPRALERFLYHSHAYNPPHEVWSCTLVASADTLREVELRNVLLRTPVDLDLLRGLRHLSALRSCSLSGTRFCGSFAWHTLPESSFDVFPPQLDELDFWTSALSAGSSGVAITKIMCAASRLGALRRLHLHYKYVLSHFYGVLERTRWTPPPCVEVLCLSAYCTRFGTEAEQEAEERAMQALKPLMAAPDVRFSCEDKGGVLNLLWTKCARVLDAPECPV